MGREAATQARLSRSAYQSLKREIHSGDAKPKPKAIEKVQLTSISTLLKLRMQGLKNVLVDMPWRHLIACITVYYLAVGVLVGGLLYWQTPDEDVPSHLEPWLIFIFRGFSLLCLSPVDESDTSAGSIVITICVMIFGTLVTLCLFDIVVEKFAVKKQAVKFADKVVLRRLPKAEGGFPMLTFRYANLSSEMICNPTLRLNFFRRLTMPGGETLMLLRTGTLHATDVSQLPPAFFLHHIVDESSPLYEPPSEANPTGCSFNGVLVMTIGVCGIADESQEWQAGRAMWTPAKVIADADFAHMLGYNEGNNTGSASSDFALFDRVNALDDLPESAELLPHRAAMGLPPEEDSR